MTYFSVVNNVDEVNNEINRKGESGHIILQHSIFFLLRFSLLKHVLSVYIFVRTQGAPKE